MAEVMMKARVTFLDGLVREWSATGLRRDRYNRVFTLVDDRLPPFQQDVVDIPWSSVKFLEWV